MSKERKIRPVIAALERSDFLEAAAELSQLPENIFQGTDYLLFYQSEAYGDDEFYLDFVKTAIPYMRNPEDIVHLVTVPLDDEEVNALFHNPLFDEPKKLFRQLKETNLDLKPFVQFFKNHPVLADEWLDETEGWKDFALFLLDEC